MTRIMTRVTTRQRPQPTHQVLLFLSQIVLLLLLAVVETRVEAGSVVPPPPLRQESPRQHASNNNNNNNIRQHHQQQQPPQQQQQHPKEPDEISKLFLDRQELHDLAQTDQWTSLSADVEFLPSHKLLFWNQQQQQQQQQQYFGNNNGFPIPTVNFTDAQLRQWAADQMEQRHGRQLSSSSTSSSSTSSSASKSDIYRLSPFVEGESEYDEYQQAWRLLGFMIDCDDDISVMDDDYYSNNGDGNNNNNRGSGDEGTGEGCHRYVIWAAYVDLDYQGGGIGEYQFWDKYSQSWNNAPCQYAAKNNNNGGEGQPRCAKMDCHLSNTHWSLLGMFKHRSLDDWMEQLFKHEGICVWTEDEYDFMSDAREAWPDGCIATGTTTQNGDAIYYATKPLSGARITIGLYTDTRCVEEYVSQGSDDPITIENVVGNVLAEGGSGDGNNNNDDYANGIYASFSNSLAAWDEALDTFRICQPCVAYDANNYGYDADDDANRGESYGTYRYGYDDDYRYNYYFGNGYVQGSDFDCYDDADYTNVNQCMKFMAKTEMNTASFRDIMLANSQGTLIDNPLAGYMNSKNQGWFKRRRNSTSAFGMWFWFVCSVVLLGYAYRSFTKVQRNTNYRLPKLQMNLKQPLVFT